MHVGFSDPASAVRQRACQLAARSPLPCSEALLVAALADQDDSVTELAAFALGERGEVLPATVDALTQVARHHPAPLCREAAVAALGAIGEPEGLATILAALTDKPAVRRRAVVALAAYDGPAVTSALERAGSDPDWQVRQAAEDLLGRLD